MTGSTQEYLSSIQPGAYVDRIDQPTGSHAVSRVELHTGVAPDAAREDIKAYVLESPQRGALATIGLELPEEHEDFGGLPRINVVQKDPDSGELDPHAIGDAIRRIALREDIAPALLDESATKGLDGPELTALGQLGIYEPRHN